jgi:Asp-tRNA(Asn)/Glu-tRNA(Gln) amidotransferase C subunit
MDRGDDEQLTDDAVAALARLAGITIAPERLPAVAATWRDLLERARELEAVDLGTVEPAISFDARWEETRR